ncbi:MAG: hypothetical protein C6P37_11090 [Caldibacillus debilis]|uniref:Uncharacterized protein n=1 Tax=Caldibacillus debilis TaxID=301148 RepID=A0A3E0K3G6_9BACI|nr:hypothetical protein [Bacillaceae bacterium]OUM93249.1 MAG: hypothetical protein BAA03_00020 [Caldibacillus debilis]REJ13891.1 MAG: hypothetical protein C6W57_15255 [Caldibacillus debilis]REJ27643.1 MAG: hypothetical protein C6P37_11090 [Caldibacillus debilis]
MPIYPGKISLSITCIPSDQFRGPGRRPGTARIRIVAGPPAGQGRLEPLLSCQKIPRGKSRGRCRWPLSGLSSGPQLCFKYSLIPLVQNPSSGAARFAAATAKAFPRARSFVLSGTGRILHAALLGVP